MNFKTITHLIGRILLTEAGLLLIPLIVSVLYGESTIIFIVPIVLLGIFGGVGIKFVPIHPKLFAKDGLVVVALAWILMSGFGAIPFVLSGHSISFVDAFFETVSGFTTTGASILSDIEALPNGLLFWRSFTHWIGGMGVLVLVMAIIPSNHEHGMHLLRAEVPGPIVGKLVSRIKDTAKILYCIYFAITVIEIILLLLGGMSLFDSCIHAFGTAGTGGFSNKGLSVGAYDNVYFDVVISIFMLLFGINFNLYYFLLIRKAKEVFTSQELWCYLGIVFVSVIIIAINISHLYENFAQSLRYSLFQVSSIITTTGFATADFNLWPGLSKIILVSLMFIGACAGSTGGGIKVSRVLILAKAAIADMKQIIHPKSISIVRLDGKIISSKTVRSVHLFLSVYIFILVISTMILALDAKDIVSTFTAVVACFNNIGPGLEVVGPMGNFSSFSNFSKLILSFDMLAGRLEIFPILLMFSPSLWRKKK